MEITAGTQGGGSGKGETTAEFRSGRKEGQRGPSKCTKGKPKRSLGSPHLPHAERGNRHFHCSSEKHSQFATTAHQKGQGNRGLKEICSRPNKE